MAGEVLRKNTKGRYTSATRTREKGSTQKTAYRTLGYPNAKGNICMLLSPKHNAAFAA